MNKNNSNLKNLNSINIFYIPLSNQQSNNQNQRLIRQNKTELSKNTLFHQQNIDTFNDAKLKYGKSQTLKESTFNRQRIHIYRRQKKQKWLQLRQKNIKEDIQINYSQPRDKILKVQYMGNNNMSLKKRRLLDQIQKNLKNKRNSSENEDKFMVDSNIVTNNVFFSEATKNQFLQRIRHNGEENNSSQLINFSSLKFQIHPKKEIALIERRKRRNLSDTIMNISKSKSPQDLHYNQLLSKNMFCKNQIKIEEKDKSEQQAFQAWQISDILASKNGIVEYTSHQTQQNQKIIKAVEVSQKSLMKEKKIITLRTFKQ